MDPMIEVAEADPRADDRFTSSLSGGSPLVKVTEPHGTDHVYGAYRAQRNDSGFVRYERMEPAAGFRWRAYNLDGTTSYFGEAARASCSIVSDGYAPLTRTVDAFGNEVTYWWGSSAYPDECRLERIEYGKSAPAAGVDNFATITFEYNRPPDCAGIPVGSQTDWRTGRKIVSGASRLDAITIKAHPPGNPASPDHTHVIALTYSSADEACSTSSLRAPVRLLTSIQESAWLANDAQSLVTLPAVLFSYGSPTVLDSASPESQPPWTTVLHSGYRANLAWGFRYNDAATLARWPSVEGMMVDVDGDGRPDRLQSEPVNSLGQPVDVTQPGADVASCRATWQQNRGPGQAFGPPQSVTFTSGQTSSSNFPRLKWAGPNDNHPTGDTKGDPTRGEGCALNGQVTSFHNSYCNVECAFGTCDANGHCDDGYECGCTQPPDVNPLTYLAYRWLDVDNDGLTDLVAAVHGRREVYNIIRGNDLGATVLEPTLAMLGYPGSWPACPATSSSCPMVGADTLLRVRTCSPLCDYDWLEVKGVIDQAPRGDCELQLGVYSALQTEENGVPPASPHLQAERVPYSRCNGLYPWFIYKNRGNGVFDVQPEIKYQPVPLESDTGDAAIVGGYSTTAQGIQDIDGDGIPDAIGRADDYDSSASTHPFVWYVWRGDTTGGFESTLHVLPTREVAALNKSDSVLFTNGATEGLLDVNGDGLAEQWRAYSTGNANLTINSGTGFRVLLGSGLTLGEIDTPYSQGSYAVRPGVIPETEAVTYGLGGQFVTSGLRHTFNRPIDVDSDGRIDVLTRCFNVTCAPYVHFNAGGQFVAPAASFPVNSLVFEPSSYFGRQLVEVRNEGLAKFTWELKRDLTDLDGNGILEEVRFNGPTMRTVSSSVGNAPSRLMTQINNQRGAITTVGYDSMHSASVEQHPELVVDGRPKASPRTQWVAKSLSVVDSLAGTTTTSNYVYKNPRYAADDEGIYGFRGFEEVEATGQSGAKTIERYSFDPDWSGRLKTKLVMPASTDVPTPITGEVRSIDETTWEARALFAGAVTTYHAVAGDHWTCKNGQNESACRSNTDTRTRTVSHLSALASTTGPDLFTPLLWQETVTRVQDGEVESPATATTTGTRRTTTSFALAADATTYRLRSTGTTREELRTGGYEVFAKTATLWDSSYRVVTDEDVWFSNAQDACSETETHCGRTHRVFDMSTGNVIETYKPAQWSGAQQKTVRAYDARKLFVATETNEVGHVRDFVYEYGTGTKLETLGPNLPPCAVTVPNSCLPGAEQKEHHKIRVDGLGRMVERWETYSANGPYYAWLKAETNAYVDSPAASVTNKTAIDTWANPRWRTEKTEVDGHGRPIKKTVFVFGEAPADQITSFIYRNDGTLAEVRVPDPALNNTSWVAYTYAFDSLGRPTQIRRPDSTNSQLRSGVDIVHDGLTKTTSEVVGAALGNAAQTRTESDVFGRLVNLREELTPSPMTWATTVYTYSADDLVRTITDPSGNTTALTHDFGGRRTQIQRASRSWRYGYDKNGNTTSEILPCSPLPACEASASYVTTVVFDALDRPTSKAIAPRNLSSTDLALFGSSTETFSWDGGQNAKGRLGVWKSFAPSTSTPANTATHYYTAMGEETSLILSTSVAGYSNLPRYSYRVFDLAGNLTSGTLYDGTPACPSGGGFTVAYDKRHLPTSVQVVPCSSLTPNSYVRNTRNVAGLVTKRYTAASTMTPFYVESAWSYDKLGRVMDQTVSKGSSLVQVVKQQLEYFGNDDPKLLHHWLGTTNHKEFDFAYDSRHQLTSVTEATTFGAYFNANYFYGDAGRFTRAKEETSGASGGNVWPRDVDYQYSGADPEHVTALVSRSTQLPLVSYIYDETGNQTLRCEGPIVLGVCSADSLTSQYDGKNQLRRVTKRNAAGVALGSEEYWYDHAGQRTHVVKRDALGAKTEMIWFVNDTEAHYDAAGALMLTYGHVPLGGGPSVARITHTPSSSGTVEYQFHGLASNTIAAVDQTAGSINASFSYAPFGEIIEATDAGAPTNGIDKHRRRMNDKYVDEVSDLAYYGFRYYDKTSMTWTQSDPLYRFVPDAAWSQPRRASLYTAHLNNPLRYLDPDGRNPLAGAAIGIGIEAVSQIVSGKFSARGFAAAAVAGAVGGWAGARIAAAAGAGVTGARIVAASIAVGPLMTATDHAVRGQRVTAKDIALSAATAAVGVGLGKLATAASKAGCSGGSCGGDVCFLAGTQVWTETGLKPIESVQVGERVLSRADDASGAQTWKRVAKTFVNPERQFLTLSLQQLDGGSTIELGVTPEHPFWSSDRGWISAGDLRVGDLVASLHGGWLRVSSSTWAQERATTYNLEVEDFHTYFVGASGAWVHNTCVKKVDPGTLRPTQDIGEMNKSQITKMAKDMRANGTDHYKPIEVGDYNGELYVGDGHHRAVAASAAQEEVNAVVTPMPAQPDDAGWSISGFAQRFSRYINKSRR